MHSQKIRVAFSPVGGWFNENKMGIGNRYIVRHTTKEVRGLIKDVRYVIDISNIRRIEDQRELQMNDIGRVVLRTTQPLTFDSYRRNRATGSLILIDEATNETVGAGMIL